jgi:hypothetical protein
MMATPTKQEIDAAAKLYLDAKAAVDKAQESAGVLRDHLAQMVKEHGFLPPRATKSLRLVGEIYKVTSTESNSVEVDGTAVVRFKNSVPARIFRKLFRREQVYVSRPSAQDIARKALSGSTEALLLFFECLPIKTNSPSLTVEPLNKKEEGR